MTGMCNGRDGESGMQFGDGDNHGLDRRGLWREERGPVDQSVGIATDHPEPRADLPLLLNVEEAARLLGVGRTMLFALIDQGRIQTVRLGRRRLVVRAGLERFVEGLSA